MTQMTPENPPYPLRSTAWWVVILLFCAACLSNIDRLVIGSMVDPVRADLHLSDLQISLVMGMAYALFYGVFGLALGVLVDLRSRRGVLFCGLTVWSLATVASGLAVNFTTLFWCRACVGLGEAAVVPAGASLIADLFPDRLRGRPISLYLVGASVGTGLATFLPALIMSSTLGHMAASPDAALPWRPVFFVCGGLGLPLALLFLTVKEPARRRASDAGPEQSPPQAFAALRAKWPVLVSLYGGFSFFYISIISAAAWGTTYLLRRFDLQITQIGAKLGLALAAAGVLGYMAGGALVDQKRLRSLNGRLAVLICACFFALPVIGCALAPSPAWGIASLCASGFAAPVVYVAMNAALLDIAPSSMRGLAVSTNNLVSTLVAFTGGPLLVSLATDRWLHDQQKIGVAIALISGPSLVLSALGFSICGFLARHGGQNRALQLTPNGLRRPA